MRGHTLFELAAALGLMAVALSAVLPATARHRDRMDVLAARETLVAALRDTRTVAASVGSASLHLDASAGHARILVGDSVLREVRIDEAGRVSVALGGGRLETEIPYNGLGLGVFANETVELVAGRARTRLVVSAYGRVRRE